MAEAPANPLRFERKFITTELGVREAESLIQLNPAVFHEVHPPRYVNSIYYDTPSWDLYQANVRGLSRRVKCRVRWYGDLLGPIGKPTLELKRRYDLVGNKDLYPLGSFTLDEGFDARAVLQKAGVPRPLGFELANLLPVLITRYRRRYYLSRDGAYRLTLDSELGFRAIGPARNRFRGSAVEDRRLVVELKFGLDAADGAARIANRFPFRLSRSSKYVLGVDLIYG